MNLAAACGWSLLRSLIVALVVVPLCWCVRQELAALSRRARAALWTLLLVPFFTPSLLTGYGYSSFSLALIRHPGWNEALYGLIVGLKSIAVGVLVMHFAPPPPVSAQALHCAKLSMPGTTTSRLRQLRALWPWIIRGPWRVAFPAAAIVFLFAFQEFEIASLMGTTAWTVWLFDAQAGGLLLARSLWDALLPVGCELLVLVLLMTFAFRSQFLPGPPKVHSSTPSGWMRWLAWGLPVSACAGVLVIPFALLGRDMFHGLLGALEDRQVYEEIFIALGFGLASGLPATLAAALLLRFAVRSTASGSSIAGGVATASCLVCSLPGMIGSLAISLALLWLFQEPILNDVYDTSFPAILALFLFLLPRALLLLLLFEAVTPQQGVHTARLLQSTPDQARRLSAGELLWQLRYRRHFLVAGIVTIWGYLELTPVSILAPPGVTSAPVRLYNLMHYGRSMVLSAMLLLAMLVPLAVFLLAALLRRPVFRVAGRALLRSGRRENLVWRRTVEETS